MKKGLQQFDPSGRIALISGSDEGKLSGAAAQLASEGHAVHITGLDAAAIAPAIESRIGLQQRVPALRLSSRLMAALLRFNFPERSRS